jgi:methionyl-tRNA formyltransferase
MSSAGRFRLAFMGTPPFAAQALEALLAAGHEVACVYCQPPRPAGRGQKPVPSAVQALAEARGLAVRSPTSLKQPAEQEFFAGLGLDAAIVAAYGLILPKPLLDAPRLGCFNIHASLLPRWRGAAPIQRAILAGDALSGVTVIRMDPGLDTGPMLLKRTVALGRRTTAASLTEELAGLGAELVVETLDLLAQDALDETPQPERGVTYAPKLDRAEGVLDWRASAIDLDRRVRALNPWPGTVFTLRGERIKLLDTRICDDEAAPGTVLEPAADGSPIIACGLGALKLTLLQRPGRRPQDGAAFLRGFPLAPGMVLGGGDADALEAYDRV